MSLGPFDLTGGPFLILYGLLLVNVVVAGFVIPRLMRPAGRKQRVSDVDALAFLAGGPGRFAETVVARMLAAGALIMTGRDRFSIATDATASSAAEHSVLSLLPPMRWREIASVLRSYADPIEERMVAGALLMRDAEHAGVRFWATLPYALLLAFGAIKLMVGDARDRPVGYLTALLVLTAAFAVIRWISVDRRTQAAHDAVAEAARQASRIRRAPTNTEVGLAVALFGTAVLAGSGWADFHRLRNNEGGGGDGGGGSDGGGSGCGGGGCGGCGG